jgi:hypothetical protein
MNKTVTNRYQVSTWLMLDKLKTQFYLCCLAAKHSPTSAAGLQIADTQTDFCVCKPWQLKATL